MALVALGIDGLEVNPGDHLCGLYAGERERDELIVPFLRAGLRAGNKCICVVDGTEPAELVATLGPDVSASGQAIGKQLDVIRSSDIYLRAGVFSCHGSHRVLEGGDLRESCTTPGSTWSGPSSRGRCATYRTRQEAVSYSNRR